jgi:hypothetical protein
MSKPSQSPAQADMVERSRKESFLDHTAALGFPPPVRPDFGPSAPAYFQRKHANGPAGRFFPLHLTQHFQERWSR